MGLHVQHISGSGAVAQGNKGWIGLSGSVVFDPSADNQKLLPAFQAAYPDAAYIFSGSTGESTSDKTVFLGDVVVSGSFTSFGGDGTVDGSGTANAATYWSDSSTVAATNFTYSSGGGVDAFMAAGTGSFGGVGVMLAGGGGAAAISSKNKISLSANHGGADAIQIYAHLDQDGAPGAGGVDMNAGTGGVAIDTTGGVSVDGADDSNFTIAGEAKSLTVSVSGGGAQKLLLQSAGTGADAVHVNASAGGIDIDSAGAVAIDAAAAVNLTTSVAGNDAVTISASAADGGILLDVGSGGVQINDGSNDLLNVDSNSADFHSGLTVNVDNTDESSSLSTGALVVDGGVAVNKSLRVGLDLVVNRNLTVNGTTTTIDTTNLEVEDKLIGLNYASGSAAAIADAGLIIGNSGGDQQAFLWDNSATEFAVISTTNGPSKTGHVDIAGYSAFRAQDINAFAMTGSVSIRSPKLHSAAALDIDADSGVLSLDGSGGINIGTAADVAVDFNAAAFDLDASGAVTIDVADGQTLSITHAGGSSFDISAAGQVDLAGESGAAVNVGSTAAALSLSTTTSGEIDITSAGALDLNCTDGAILSITHGGGSELQFNATGQVDLSGESGAAVNIGSTAAQLALTTTTSGEIDITSAAALDMNAGDAVTIDSSGGTISIGADDVDQTINIGTNGDRTIVIGKSGGSTTTQIHSDGGDLVLDAGSRNISTTGDLVPTSDNAHDLGSSSARFRNIYTGDLHLANERGNWTLVEESDMLTFRNNLTGRWYRMNMEEIDPTGRDEGMNGPAPVGSEGSPAGDPDWEV